MPEPKTINCEVCGTVVEVQRLSARYCKDCKPKALVLNTVIRQLNRLFNLDPLMLAELFGQQAPASEQVMNAFPNMAGRASVNLLDLLNIGLSEYGQVSYDSRGFHIQPDPGQITLRSLFASEAEADEIEMGVDTAAEGGDETSEVVFRRRRGSNTVHAEGLHRRTGSGVSVTDYGDPGSLPDSQSLEFQSHSTVYGFEANPQTPAEFDEAQFHLVIAVSRPEEIISYLNSREILHRVDDSQSEGISVFFLQDGRVLMSLTHEEIRRLQTGPRWERELDLWRERFSERQSSNDERRVQEEIMRRQHVTHAMLNVLEREQRMGRSIRSQINELRHQPTSNWTPLLRERFGLLQEMVLDRREQTDALADMPQTIIQQSRILRRAGQLGADSINPPGYPRRARRNS